MPNETLRSKRQELKLSMDAMTRQLGISRTHYGNIEHEVHTPSVKLAIAISEVLGCSVEYLFAEGDKAQDYRLQAERWKAEYMASEDSKATLTQERNHFYHECSNFATRLGRALTVLTARGPKTPLEREVFGILGGSSE